MNTMSIGFSLPASATAPPTQARLKQLTREATGALEAQAILATTPEARTRRQVWRATIDGAAFKRDPDNLFRLPDCEPRSTAGALNQ